MCLTSWCWPAEMCTILLEITICLLAACMWLHECARGVWGAQEGPVPAPVHLRVHSGAYTASPSPCYQEWTLQGPANALPQELCLLERDWQVEDDGSTLQALGFRLATCPDGHPSHGHFLATVGLKTNISLMGSCGHDAWCSTASIQSSKKGKYDWIQCRSYLNRTFKVQTKHQFLKQRHCLIFVEKYIYHWNI